MADARRGTDEAPSLAGRVRGEPGEAEPLLPPVADPQARSLLAGFGRFARRAGYRLVDPAPLLSDDATVPFTNATITPFKPPLLDGQRLPAVALAQPCLRLRPLAGRARAFTMLGLMAPGNELDRVARDGLRLLRAALPTGTLEVVCAEGDEDLAAAAARHADRALAAPAGTTALRWRFGAGELLVGRGLAVCWSPSPAGPRELIATLVRITHTVALTEHVEIAAGLEPLAALGRGVTPFELAPLADVRQALVAEDVAESAANGIADLVAAVAAAVAAGARPSGRGRGHAVRRLLVDARRLLAEQALPDERLDDLLALVGADDAVREVVAAEVRAAGARRVKAERAARAYVRRQRARGREVGADELHDTFGLSPDGPDPGRDGR